MNLSHTHSSHLLIRLLLFRLLLIRLRLLGFFVVLDDRLDDFFSLFEGCHLHNEADHFTIAMALNRDFNTEDVEDGTFDRNFGVWIDIC